MTLVLQEPSWTSSRDGGAAGRGWAEADEGRDPGKGLRRCRDGEGLMLCARAGDAGRRKGGA